MANEPTEGEPVPYRSRYLRSRIETHGDDVVDTHELNLPILLIQALVPSVVLGLFGLALWGAIQAEGWLNGVAITFTALLALPALTATRAILWLLRYYRSYALLYKDRLIFKQGSRETEVLWDEVDAVYLHTSAGKDHTRFFWPPGYPDKVYMEPTQPLMKFWKEWTDVQLRDGTSFRIYPTFWGYDEFSGQVQGEVAGRELPRALARLQAGQTLEFGPIRLDANGLTVGDSQTTWQNHWCTWIEEGHLVSVDSDSQLVGEWVPTDEVPNVGMVSLLIDKAIQANRREDSEASE